MKLYDTKLAPNPRRVRMFLAEKGVSVPTVEVDLGRLEQRAADYTAKNPMQRTPALELDDGTVISESIAICRYIEELHPEPPLFGIGALERAVVEMWQRRLEFNLFGAIAAAFRHLHPAMKEMEVPQVPSWGEANKPRVLDFLRVLDGHLAARPFVCGERFTVADITGLVSLDFMRPARLAVPEECRNVRRWYADLSARPSAKA